MTRYNSRCKGGDPFFCGNCCWNTYFIGMADPYYWYMKLEELRFGTELLKRGFASMQKGGVIMDVVNAEQARIAESAGAVAVMSLERVPSDIRKQGGVARMADPEKVMEIIDAVSIPVMGKVRIGHFVEAQVLEELGVDMIDESEVPTPADEEYHIDKKKFKVPFVCGARNLGEALRRVNEGAAMIRTKGEAGTGNVVEAVRHMRAITGEIRKVQGMDDQERISYARTIEAPGRTGYRVRPTGPSPGGEFLGRRHCNAFRCCLDDAAWG